MRKAILASIQEVDPAKPWIKDASGRHTNVMAVLDWPNSDDSDTEDLYTVTDGKIIILKIPGKYLVFLSISCRHFGIENIFKRSHSYELFSFIS